MVSLLGNNQLGPLLDEGRGVIGAVLGTYDGELRTTIGKVHDGHQHALVAATLAAELNKVGMALGFGSLELVSLKAPNAARVIGRQSGALILIEVDPKRGVGELETKLRSVAWAPTAAAMAEARARPAPVDEFPDSFEDDELVQSSDEPVITREPTRPNLEQQAAVPKHILPRPQTGKIHVTGPIRTVQSDAGARDSRQTAKPAANGVPSPVPSVGSGPVFAGDLEEFALPDLLEFMRNSHRTGQLVCTHVTGTGTIRMSRGMVISANSPGAVELRQLLLDSTELAPEIKIQLAALPPDSFSDEHVDAAIAARELVPKDQLDRARTARIYSAFREMIGWTSGRFAFDPGVAVTSNPAIALNARNILMQIYQAMDDSPPVADE